MGAGHPSSDPLFAYLREIERFWLLLRRRGLMLSPRDVQQIEAWAEAGIPARVVCRGLLEGADRFRARHHDEREFPSSLRYFRTNVEEVAARHAASVLGAAPAPTSAGAEADPVPEPPAEGETLDAQALLPPIVDAGRAEQDERVRQAYRNAYRALDALALSDASAMVERLIDIDRSIVDDVWHAIAEEERAALREQLDQQLADERDRLGELGYRERRRALLEDFVTRRWNLLRLLPGPPDGPRVVGMGWGRLMDER